MPLTADQSLEARLVERHERGELDGIADELVRAYGPEIVGYLNRILGSESLAGDVFQDTCEALVRYLPRFRRSSSFRTWMYVVARNRATKVMGKAGREVGLSRGPEPQAVARSVTSPFMKTDVKDSVRLLRQQLSEEDQTLLVLRIDRGMDWLDIARVMTGDAELASSKEAARLRKKYQRLKDRLRRLAREQGILTS